MSETTPLTKETKADAVPSTEGGTPKPPDYAKTSIVVTVILAIGTGIAYAATAFDGSKELRDAKIAGLKEQDLQWVFLALVVLGRSIQLLNFVPTSYKSGLKGNIRSNPFFYETHDGKKTPVYYQEEGSKGMYNRANRSIQHMVENFGAFLASIGPVGYVFPRQVLGVVVVFSLGRILHQKGYSGGYGRHALGFVLATLSMVTMEGLSLLAFLKAEQIIA